MPYLETVEELAEALADMCGIYNQGLRFEGQTVAESRAQSDWLWNHADDCGCRMCWCGRMEIRIRAAVAHDDVLDRTPVRPTP